MNLPINEHSYFMLGLDDRITEAVPYYTSAEYEIAHSSILLKMPLLFSINLKKEIVTFITKAPPHFVSNINQVIEIACYYYNDWESVVAVTDEFIQTEVLDKVRNSLVVSYDGNTSIAQERLDDIIAQLATALVEFITTIIDVLSRAGVPGIEDYGSAYRLDCVHDSGDIYFRLHTPEQVRAELEGRLFQINTVAKYFKGK